MTQLVDLLLTVPPFVAVAGGAVLLVLAVLHLVRVHALPRIPLRDTLPAVAAALLGVALLGLGLTYILTSGRTGHNTLYIAWLVVALLSALLALLPHRA